MSAINLSEVKERDKERIEALEARSGVKLSECYQCGKCTAGCPMVESMDIVPRQVLRYLQLGLVDDVLKSRAPWICATCVTCSARCPHDVRICELMEAVRQEADRSGIHPVRRTKLFTKFFLLPVRLFGRSHELSMIAFYNMMSGRLMQNFNYLPEILKGGKLKIFPDRIKGRDAIKRIMNNCEKEAGR